MRYPRYPCFHGRLSTLLVGSVTLFFSSNLFILSINVKLFVSFTGKTNFVVCDTLFQELTIRSDRSVTITCTEY